MAGKAVVAIVSTVLALALSLAPAQATSMSAEWEREWDLIRTHSQLEELSSARRYVLVGKLTDGGCQFEYPKVTLPASESAILVRDVAIDTDGCRRLVEEGIPLGLLANEVEAREKLELGWTGQDAQLQSVSSAAGYHQVWWTDLPGLTVNLVRTRINWTYDGSWVRGGSASKEVSWLAATGWEHVSSSVTQDLTGTRFRGSTKATFWNRIFCIGLPATVTFYNYVRALGYFDGSLSGERSTRTDYQCLPLFANFLIRRTT